jgi:hypothetical protein
MDWKTVISGNLPGVGVWLAYMATVGGAIYMACHNIPIPDDIKYVLGAGTALIFKAGGK